MDIKISSYVCYPQPELNYTELGIELGNVTRHLTATVKHYSMGICLTFNFLQIEEMLGVAVIFFSYFVLLYPQKTFCG